MKIAIAIGVLISVCCSGCATSGNQAAHDSRPGVQSQYPTEFMFVSSSGAKAAFSAREIEGIAKDYIRTKKVPYDISDASMTIWIDTTGGKTLATVDFGRGIGKQSLIITIDKDGRVLRHEILWAID